MLEKNRCRRYAHMCNLDVLPVFNGPCDRPYTLAKEIRAIELATDANSEMRLGPVSKIPAGSDIECCGQGFNEATVKVHWRGKFYFVFQ